MKPRQPDSAVPIPAKRFALTDERGSLKSISIYYPLLYFGKGIFCVIVRKPGRMIHTWQDVVSRSELRNLLSTY